MHYNKGGNFYYAYKNRKLIRFIVVNHANVVKS